MLNTIFQSILSGTSIQIGEFLICFATAIVLGLLVAGIYMYQNQYSKNFVITLALLPVIVQMVILMVNGNLGTGVAVMGAFSLIRFRSVPGSARDIGSIFMAMAVGLATSMGYIGIALVFVILVGSATLFLYKVGFGEHQQGIKELKISIPENLDYTEIFDDLFQTYLSKAELLKVKTSNMGSLFELTYQVSFKNENQEREFINEIRCRNGNLSVSCRRNHVTADSL